MIFWLSIVIPVYNTDAFLEDALATAIAARSDGVEIIVVNDGSTDGSDAIIARYAETTPDFVVHRQHNMGLGPARNAGLGLARGDYIWFVDSDDMIDPGAVEGLRTHIESSDYPDLLLFSARKYDCRMDKSKPDYMPGYDRRCNLQGLDGSDAISQLKKKKAYFASACCYIAKTDLMRRQRILYPCCIHEDEAVFLELLLKSRYIDVSREQYFVRRVRDGSVMTGRKGQGHSQGRRFNLNHAIQSSEQNRFARYPGEARQVRKLLKWRVDYTLQRYLESVLETDSDISLEHIARAFLSGYPNTINRGSLKLALKAIARRRFSGLGFSGESNRGG